VEGVRALDHTADVGLALSAPDLALLLERAIRGLDWLLRESAPPEAREERPLEVQAPDPPSLLRAVLRETLAWHDLEGLAPAGVEVKSTSPGSEGSPARVRARVRVGRPDGPPVREIKGVTLHGLRAARASGGWEGRVIFDV
jgi:SHS2 domain-containing protein